MLVYSPRKFLFTIWSPIQDLSICHCPRTKSLMFHTCQYASGHLELIWPFFSDHSNQQGVSIHRTNTFFFFSCFCTTILTLKSVCVFKYSNHSFSTNTMPQLKSQVSGFFFIYLNCICMIFFFVFCTAVLKNDCLIRL